MFVIQNAAALVEFVKDFTGSTNDEEIKKCIFMAELSMRNIELPALRSDPYSVANMGIADSNGRVDIPGDMNKPIIFFKQGTTGTASTTGPWIVYDRIGDRDIISQSLISQLYIQPTNVPAVIRGKFSEVGNKYEFLPALSEGDIVNMYYYEAWPLLFAPADDLVIGATATVGNITSPPGTAFYAQLTGLTSTAGVEVGDELFALDGTGSIGTGGVYTVTAVDSPTALSFKADGGTTPIAGIVTNVAITNQTVETNPVLATWPEGYVYGTLREYYIKRHNDQDAAVYDVKFKQAMQVVEDQNNLGKWSGGHTRLTSVWQPRKQRQYTIN